MSFSLSNHVLLRGMLAGAVVLTGTACSRSDRTETGRDTGAAILPDTGGNAAQPSSGGTATGTMSDTATISAQSDSSAQPSTSVQSNTPRRETAPASDKDAAGYRPMERDTTDLPDSDSARVSADTAETPSTEMAGASDTTAADQVEMARDTSTVVDQTDTAATSSGDVALQAPADTSSPVEVDPSPEPGVAVADAADTTGNAGRIRPPEDSTEILGQVSPDSVELVRVRPPEDSTELLGNVHPDEAADETADEQVVRPEDRETVAASEAPPEEVGAAAIGGNVTGAEAVALTSRDGVRCAIVDPEANEAVRWDMSSTPVALNPCGMGSMVLSRIWTEK